MDAIFKFLKQKFIEIYNLFLGIKPLNELFAVVLGFGLFIVLKIVLKFLIKKFNLTLIKRILNRSIILLSVMLSFSLSSSAFFAQKGLLLFSIFLVWNIYRIIDYAVFDYYIAVVKKNICPKDCQGHDKGACFYNSYFYAIKPFF